MHMNAPVAYPLLMDPIYKDYVWGGNRILQVFRRPVVPGVFAESWEVSDRIEGSSTVANGPFKGTTLRDLLHRCSAEIIGRPDAAFPLLVKLIDARNRLSVQVHPDDESAARFGGQAKTEAWHILDAPPGGRVYAGLQPGATEASFRAALRDKHVLDCLQEVPVRPGDTVFIPGGRVHAIDEGLLILEVQQNSDTTYRVYDWDYVGKDGKPRPLHTEEAMRVIRWRDDTPPLVIPRPLDAGPHAHGRTLVSCPYFQLDELTLTAPVSIQSGGNGFEILFPVEHDLVIRTADGTTEVPYGKSCLLPAAIGPYYVSPAASRARCLRITAGARG